MKHIVIILFLLSITSICFSQTQTLDSIPKDGIVLNKGWKFQAGDNAEWAKPDFDDSHWQPIDPTLDVNELPQLRQQPIGWLRIHFHVDSGLLNKPLAYHIFQSIASQVFINGKFTDNFGVVSEDRNKIKEWRPSNDPKGIVFTQAEQTVAVRFSLKKKPIDFHLVTPFNGFVFRIRSIDSPLKNYELPHQFPYQFAVLIGFYTILCILHFILHLNQPQKKANLYFSIVSFFFICSGLLALYIYFGNTSISSINIAQCLSYFQYTVIGDLLLYLAIRHLFFNKKNTVFWLIVGVSIATPLIIFLELIDSILWSLVILSLAFGESTRITYLSYKHGNKKAGILLIAFCIYWSFLIIVIFRPNQSNTYELNDFFWTLSTVSIPLSLTIYLSLDFASTSKELEKKLIEVHQLSNEKQQILLSQNETLEQQVAQRTSQLNQSLQELKSTQAQLIQSEKMASLGELTAGIAHEIQNPLNFVNNFSEVSNELMDEMNEELDKGDIKEAKAISNDIKENLQKINHHGKRADAIVKGMLQHSRQNKVIREPTNINALCDEYLRLSYHGLRAKDKNFNADFQADFDENIGKIKIVPQDMGRVLLNLFNNAFYAVGERQKVEGERCKPMVSVTTRKLNSSSEVGGIEIIVKDNGYGIPQVIIDKIFQPFFTTKPTGQGTGLGLSLAYDIITKEHGGTIKAESKEGKGTSFIITLPA